MSEKIPNSLEHIPTLEEVREVLNQMTGGKDFKEVQRLLDEQGNLYRLDVVVEGTEEGDSLELFYRMKASSDMPAEINIHSVYVRGDSIGPAGPQATFTDGNWVVED